MVIVEDLEHVLCKISFIVIFKMKKKTILNDDNNVTLR